MRLTVQGWLNVVLATMGGIVLAGAVAGVVMIRWTDQVSDDLINHVQPARVAAYQLQAALRDQETAIRGYAIAADRQFLEPYDEGQSVATAAAADIRSLVGDHKDLMVDLDAIQRAADRWRATYAAPLIVSVTPSRPTVVDEQTAERGKSEFDSMRALFDTQNAHLEQVRNTARDELNHSRSWRDGMLIAVIAAFFVTALLLAVWVRGAVVRPLDALAAACRRITQGSFGERIIIQGPKDIRAIAVDVEEMRQRIVDELEASRSAQASLDQQAGELRRSNAELEQFAYVASHDLQEPLRKVASFCQLLEKRYGDKLDERGVEYVGFAVDGAKRMQVLINDLLTFSRVGRLNATRSEVDLGSALAIALTNLSAAVEDSGADIVLPSEPLPCVDGDLTLLTMVWQNLIGNAVKFGREGFVPHVVIECRPDDDAWLFSVSDNGIGIGEEFVDKVFVIFQRLHGRDAYGGTGIGLALCKKIVEYHGGSIWIDTSYPGGARINFTLPRMEGNSE